MKKRILAYLDYVDSLFEKDNIDWEQEIQRHLVQIAFFAHERLVHLIVTVLFAIMTIISIIYLNYSGNMMIFALVAALMVLLVPYIKHYYLLENSVQKMYDQYDKMLNRTGNAFSMDKK